MTTLRVSTSLIVLASLLGLVAGQDDVPGCYRLSLGAIVGIILADIVITIFIALATHCLTKRGMSHRKTESLAMQQSSKPEVQTESPYEDLRIGERSLYSELRPIRK